MPIAVTVLDIEPSGTISKSIPEGCAEMIDVCESNGRIAVGSSKYPVSWVCVSSKVLPALELDVAMGCSNTGGFGKDGAVSANSDSMIALLNCSTLDIIG